MYKHVEDEEFVSIFGEEGMEYLMRKFIERLSATVRDAKRRDQGLPTLRGGMMIHNMRALSNVKWNIWMRFHVNRSDVNTITCAFVDSVVIFDEMPEHVRKDYEHVSLMVSIQSN